MENQGLFQRLKIGFWRFRKRLFRNFRYVSNPQKFWSRLGELSSFEIYPPAIQKSQEDFLVKMDKELKPKTVLDIGCGYGRLLKLFGTRGTGVDFGDAQVRRAQALGFNAVQADVTQKLPFADNSFDLVYSFGVLMHIPPAGIDTARQEILRVSKKYILHCEALDTSPVLFGHNQEEYYKKLGLKVTVLDPKSFEIKSGKTMQVVLIEK